MSALLEAESVGPVDVAVIKFDSDRLDGDVAAAIRDLQDGGTVRVVDLSFVRKLADGTVTMVEVVDSEVAEHYAGLADDDLDLLSEEDLMLVAGKLSPGSAALVVVWENTWASRLASAVRSSHGEVTMLERIPRPVVLEALTALQEES